MAITKTTTVHDVTIIVSDVTDYTLSTICLTLVDTLDDPNDAELPIKKTRRENITPGTNVSSYPQFVQDIAATVWGS